MANLARVELDATYDWSTEDFHVIGKVHFLFGATAYVLGIDQHVSIPTEYANVADQVEHVFFDIAGRLGRLNNAQLTLEADEVKTYL